MTSPPRTPARRADTPVEGRVVRDPGVPGPRLALVDLLDRVLAGGVVVTGEIVLSIADIDLVVVSLRALVTSVSALDGPVPVAQRAAQQTAQQAGS
jgi:hypothetical protein